MHELEQRDACFDFACDEDASPPPRHDVVKKAPSETSRRSMREPSAVSVKSIVLIENRRFVRECMQRGLEFALDTSVVSFSTLSEIQHEGISQVSLFLISLHGASKAECIAGLDTLSTLYPWVPVAVILGVDDKELASTAVSRGAKGYIPVTANFEIAVEAVRFILAGGTYVPMDYMFSSSPIVVSGLGNGSTANLSSQPNVLTNRELSVVRAIQEGKSNKVIAYKLCICEGTVKVHLRNIMKKLSAKNRTEVAIKAQMLMPPALDQSSYLQESV